MKKISFFQIVSIGLLTVCMVNPTHATVTVNAVTSNQFDPSSVTENYVSYDDNNEEFQTDYSGSSNSFEPDEIICLDDNDSEVACPSYDFANDTADETTDAVTEGTMNEYSCVDEYDKEVPCDDEEPEKSGELEVEVEDVSDMNNDGEKAENICYDDLNNETFCD